jgi:hypothetical protein
MVIAGRIQRYIFRECVASLALTLSIILLAIILVDVVEQMRTIGDRTQIGVGVVAAKHNQAVHLARNQQIEGRLLLVRFQRHSKNQNREEQHAGCSFCSTNHIQIWSALVCCMHRPSAIASYAATPPG